jgi:hypothetical protein
MVAYGGGANSMLQFQLEMRGDGTIRCRKMKWMQRARLGSIGRKRDMVSWRDDAGWRRCGTEEEKRRRRCRLV